MARLAVQPRTAWLRPYGAALDQYELSFRVPLPPHSGVGEAAGAALNLGSAVSHTWTLEFDPPGGDTLLHAWTPLEYRKFTLEGPVAASFTVLLEEEGDDLAPRPDIPRQMVGGGTVVSIVPREHKM